MLSRKAKQQANRKLIVTATFGAVSLSNLYVKKGRALFFELISLSLSPQPAPARFFHGQRIDAYGCSVPGLTRFTPFVYMGPDYQRHLWQYGPSWSVLRKEFSLAIADFEYRVPLPPRLARPFSSQTSKLRVSIYVLNVNSNYRKNKKLCQLSLVKKYPTILYINSYML